MKKCLCLLLSLTMLCLCAGAALAETVALKVWGSQEDQELLAELCEAFAAEHPETTYEFTYGVVGEADAKARYLEDPAAAADVFSYPDDQIIDLVNADALYEVTRNHDAIVAANSVGSVNAASVGGVLYGYRADPAVEALEFRFQTEGGPVSLWCRTFREDLFLCSAQGFVRDQALDCRAYGPGGALLWEGGII